MNQPQQPRPCGVCGDLTHLNDKCPLIQEGTAEVNAMDYGPRCNFGNNYNQGYDSNYQSGFYRRGQQQQVPFQRGQYENHPRNTQQDDRDETLRLLLDKMSVQEKLLSQMAKKIGELKEKDSKKLPSQVVVNPKENG